MATRNILHVNELQEFEDFIKTKGFIIVPTGKNPFVILRAQKDGDTVIVYQKKYLSTMDKDYMYNRELIKNQVKQSNADRIRSMTDEELAKFLSDFSACKICEHYNKEFDRCDSIPLCVKEYAEAIILDWLNKPVEE